MLIFVKGVYERQIVAGRKTSTIRPWKKCKLQPGDPLTFNGRVRTRITQIEQRRLGDLTAADCQADGFASRAEFRRVFFGFYPALTLDSLVYILHFAPPKRSAHSARATDTSASGPV